MDSSRNPLVDIKNKLVDKRKMSKQGSTGNAELMKSPSKRPSKVLSEKKDSINSSKKSRTKSSEHLPASFDTLNKDVYDFILSFLPVFPDVMRVSMLNKKFHEVVQNSSIWTHFSLQQQALFEETEKRPSSDSQSAYDCYVFPVREQSVDYEFPDPIQVLSHPLINSNVIKELDLTGVGKPEACLCYILKNPKFSNLQKLSLASFTEKFPKESDYIDENESKEGDKKYQSYIAKFSSVMKEKLPAMSQLTHLNLLGMTTLTTEVFVRIIPCFPALKYLVLTGCQLLRPTPVIEAIAKYCPKLEMIAAEYTPISVQQLVRIKSLKVVLCDETDHNEKFPFKEVSKDLLELMRENTPESLAQFAELLTFVAQPQLQTAEGYTVLFLACCEKNPPLEYIRLLLGLPNVDVNFMCNTRPINRSQLFNPWVSHFPWQVSRETKATNTSGLSCLHQLMSHERLKTGSLSEVISLFLQHGADPYLMNSSDQMSPLAIAVFRQAFGAAKELMTSIPVGSDMNGETIIHYLCKYKEDSSPESYPMIEAAMHYGYDINALSSNGYSALLYAAAKNNLRVVKFLLSKGAKVFNTDYFHHFLWKRCTEVDIFELLYQNGLDLSYKVQGRNVLHQKGNIKPPSYLHKGHPEYAVNRTEIFKWILSKKEGKILATEKSTHPVLHTLVTHTLSEVRYNMVKALLKAGADPNELDENRHTPFMVMCRRCDSSTVEVENEDDYVLQTREMYKQQQGKPKPTESKLDRALQETRFGKMLSLLKSFGANVNATDNRGRSVAHMAVELSEYKKHMLPVLLKCGIDFGLRDKDNVTPLFLLAWHEKFELMATLLRGGVVPEREHHPSGMTVLHALCQTRMFVGSEKIVQEIFDRIVASGIDINQQDIAGWTALHWAVATRNENLCKMLLDAKANVSLKTNLGYSALTLAFMPVHSYESEYSDFVYDTPKPNWNHTYLNLKAPLVKKMFALNPDLVMEVDKNSTNLLHWLARSFDSHAPSVVQLLLKHSTKEMINQQDKQGNTPLHYLLARYRAALKEAKEDDDEKQEDEDNDEEDEDDEEEKEGKEEEDRDDKPSISNFGIMMKELLKRGAKLNILNKNLEAACHLYCDLPKGEATHSFFEKMTAKDWNTQDSEGNTVLHKLASSDQLNLCNKEMLQMADSSLINYAGRSPLHEACYHPSESLLTLLELPQTNVLQTEVVSKRTPLAILLRQYIREPSPQTAKAIQFLLNHPQSSKMMTLEVSELATPELMEEIKGQMEEKKEETKPIARQEKEKVRYLKIMKKPQVEYRDKFEDSDEDIDEDSD